MHFPIIEMSSCRDVMLRVFSPTGFNVNSPPNAWFWITDFRDFWISRMIVGANCIRPPMIQVHFPIVGMTCSTVRLPNTDRFQCKFTPNAWFWIRIFRIAEDVFGLAQWSFVEDYFIPFFSPLRNASANGLAMKAACNITFPPKPTTL